MKEEHARWDPSRSQYSQDFEKRLEDSFDKYLAKKETTSEAPDNLIPLSLLEITLAVGENMHKVGFHSADQVFPILVSTIREYTKVHKGGIFDHYYGFLCVRHLIRMVCIGVMTQNGTFEDFLRAMDKQMPWQAVTGALSKGSLDILTDALATENLMNVAELIGCAWSARGNAFEVNGGLSYQNVAFLVEVLYKARAAIIPLRKAGLLPGLPGLLFVLHQMTIFGLGKMPPNFAYGQIMQQGLADDEFSPCDESDARVAIEAYIELLSPPELNLNLAPVMLLDISAILFRWVFGILTSMGRRRVLHEELVPDVIKAGLARLWLEIDREWDGPMQAPRRGFTRNYAAHLFERMRILEGRIGTPKVRAAFTQMLVDVNLHSLVGRVLMFVTRETNNDPDSLGHLLVSMEQLQRSLRVLPDPTPAEIENIALEWRKVFLHLLYHLHSDLTPTPKHLISDGMEAWDCLRPASVKRAPDLFECMNPRCAIRVIYERPPESKTVCGGCNKARYCDPRCQQM
ncbi:Zf-MYND domain-containing protein [Ceratobasidium theobromae]|uniref:Zf-MYND domain-containing protein n=1 Tax=Ceratobasidium theobromae TaxID=1582974 RepID=A0A5N5QH35_9AGAM|nr:Zf-MYND domain-containing protein [Ceratobasidium theobromae]